MKNIRNIVIGIIIGLILAVPINAAVQEYALKQSEWKVVVDGQVIQDERYPVLLMDPGYNYVAAGNFRDICAKAGIPFEVSAEAKEIRITTKQTTAVKITPTSSPTVTYFEPYTIDRDGIKKVFIGDINKLLKPKGYELSDSHKSDGLLWLRLNGAPAIKDIPNSIHDYNGQGGVYIDYDFYIEHIKPLID